MSPVKVAIPRPLRFSPIATLIYGGQHDQEACPGWHLARDGAIEACTQCVTDRARPYELAARFFADVPGLAVFQCDQARTGFEIQRDDDMAVFSSDDEAVRFAVALCETMGYVVKDGPEYFEGKVDE